MTSKQELHTRRLVPRRLSVMMRGELRASGVHPRLGDQGRSPEEGCGQMRRKVTAMTGLVALLGGTLFLLVAPAASAQPYPPGVCTVTTADSGNVGSFDVGDSFAITLRAVCTFTAGGTAAVTVNGQSAGTKPIQADGSVIVSVNVLSATQLSVNPIVGGRCGVNTVSVTGPSASARTNVTQSASFSVLCPGVAAVPRAVKGRVAFTGDNIARWSAVALLLVAIGGSLVMLDRRRARARS